MAVSKEQILEEIKLLTGLELAGLFDIGLIHPKQAKKWIVKERYYRMARTGRTYTDIKLELSVDYDISVSSIEKMVYRK